MTLVRLGALGLITLASLFVVVILLVAISYWMEPDASRLWARKKNELRDSLENRRVK